jgi:hypothetical protein
MRAMFGLVGLLVTLGIIVWIMGMYTPAVMKADKGAREQVNQIAGNDPETGARASYSADLQPLNSGGKLSGVLVTRVQDDGAYGKYFGLQRNDTIIAAVYQGARMDIKDMNGDEEMAKAQISEAYQRQGSLIVVRDGKQLELPGAQAQEAVKAAEKTDDTALQNQLNAMQGTPR